MTPDMTHAIDQATAGVDNNIRIMVKEIRSQLADGYSEDNIMLGLCNYLNKHTEYTRGEFATQYMRALLMLAKSGE